MKSESDILMRALAVCALALTMAAGGSVFGRAAGHSGAETGSPQSKDKPAQISKEEIEAGQKIEAAPDVATKLQLAEEFAKKYPKSTKLHDVAGYVASQVAQLEDQAQMMTLSEKYLTVFPDTKEASVIRTNLMTAYVKAGKVDEAFSLAAAFLQKQPADIPVLTQMALVGADQIKQNNPKYLQQTQTYGAKAIQLIEAGQKPEGLTDEQWAEYQNHWLPQLYYSMGFLSLVTGKTDEAKMKAEKALTLNPNEPLNYMLVGYILNQEYQQLAEKYKGMPDGAGKDETLKQAQAKLDDVIDKYAHMVGLAEGDTRYDQIREQVSQDLEAYYKYRHNGSTDGLRAMIDKYKKP